jgi:hypothetical protein
MVRASAFHLWDRFSLRTRAWKTWKTWSSLYSTRLKIDQVVRRCSLNNAWTMLLSWLNNVVQATIVNNIVRTSVNNIVNKPCYYTFSMYSRSWLVREHRIILNVRYLLRNFSCWRAQRPIIVFLDRTCIQKKYYWTLLCPSPGTANNSNSKARENKINILETLLNFV